MPWELDSDRPIYAQIVDRLKHEIVSGFYPPGSRLPSVRDLAAQASVNPNTMQRTLAAMEEAGLLTSQRNTGRFVTQDTALICATRDALAKRELSLFREKMKQLGYSGQEITQLLMEVEPHE